MCTSTGAGPGFQIRVGALKKNCAERMEVRKFLGYFVWKIIFFPIFRRDARRVRLPLDPPLIIYMFCRTLFLISSFFFCPLCSLSFFNLQILIAHLITSNSSIYVFFSKPKSKLGITYNILLLTTYHWFTVNIHFCTCGNRVYSIHRQ